MGADPNPKATAATLAEETAQTAETLADETTEKARVLEEERAALAIAVAERVDAKIDARLQVMFRRLRLENFVMYGFAIAAVIVAVVMG